MKSDGFPVDHIYQILPSKDQCFYHVLEDLEIPQNRIDFYANSLQQGQYLLVINSTESQIKQIQAILEFLNMVDWQIYYTPRGYQVNSPNFDKFTLFDDSIYSMMLN